MNPSEVRPSNLSQQLQSEFEPILTDERMDRISSAFHRRYPETQDFKFYAYYQPAEERTLDDGARIKLKERAGFAVLIPNPRYANAYQLFFSYTPYEDWVKRDRDKPDQAKTDITLDPAFQVFQIGSVKAALDWYGNMKALM